MKPPVHNDGMQCKALKYSGAQMLTITVSFAKQFCLPIEQLSQILNFEATGGGRVPCLSYVEINLQIPGAQAFNEDVQTLVLEDSEYGHQVPI